ncbi:MAG: hypothetical protein ACLFTY_00290 [Candidatus Aenigmatarchaeota archaeon]
MVEDEKKYQSLAEGSEKKRRDEEGSDGLSSYEDDLIISALRRYENENVPFSLPILSKPAKNAKDISEFIDEKLEGGMRRTIRKKFKEYHGEDN